MRIQPPPSNKKDVRFTFKEFEKYILYHDIIQKDGTTENVVEFFNTCLVKTQDKNKLLEDFLTMWPYEYQNYVRIIFQKKFNYNRVIEE